MPPPEFERTIGERSVIVFGAPGSGKTTLYRRWIALGHDADGNPRRLLVEWRPRPLPPQAQPTLAWVKLEAERVLEQCALSLVQYLAQHPDDYSSVPEWARARWVWFIHRFVPGDLALRLGPLDARCPAGSDVIHRLSTATVHKVLYDDAPLDAVTWELTNALHPLGLDGIWVLSDGLEGLSATEPDRLNHSLRAFLSVLSLFEHSNIAYKLCIPARLEPTLSHAGGVLRRRLDSIRLRWDEMLLRHLVERRLATVLGQGHRSLEQLCDAPNLIEWLNKVGGHSPRAWLDQVAPLVKKCVAQSHCVNEAEWKERQSEKVTPPFPV